jgi:hypothetical protein
MTDNMSVSNPLFKGENYEFWSIKIRTYGVIVEESKNLDVYFFDELMGSL